MQATEIQEFEAVLEQHPEMNATYFIIPFRVPEVYQTKGQVKVRVTIKNQTFPGLLAPMGGGNHVLGLRKELREKLELKTGDQVKIQLEKETEPRQVILPEDLKIALERNPEISAVFEKLAYTHRREYVDWIEEAKKPETRQRRLEKTLEKLSATKKP